MLVLLSSDYSPRYKQDVLRCLATPTGCTVQFRYDKVHISDSVLEQLGGKLPLLAPAIVCSVATKGIGPLTIVPVRAVDIVTAREHGSTVSVVLRMKEIVQADPAQFTAEIDKMSAGASPRKKTEDDLSPEGKYFFHIGTLPEGCEQKSDLRIWEQTVTRLREQQAYQDEVFFWTVVGIQREAEHLDPGTLHAIPDRLPAGSNFEVLIYHYQPRGGQKPNSRLELKVGPGVDLVVPPDAAVDSRYDFKTWNCHTSSSTQASRESWLRIRTSGDWELDIPIRIASAWKRWILRAIVTGVLLAIPSIAAVAPQPLSGWQKAELCGAAALFGFFAALAATFNIDRLG